MLKKWKRLSAMLRVASFAILAALLIFVGFQVYQFYNERIGLGPKRVIDNYFGALAGGNYTEVYRLTAKSDLTDIYGRPLTEDEFLQQVQKLTGGKRFVFERIESVRLFEKGRAQYYAVRLYSSVGGNAGESRLVVEALKEGSNWVLRYPFAIVL